MADNQANKNRIAELQKQESAGTLSDEDAAELQRLQNETPADDSGTGDSSNK